MAQIAASVPQTLSVARLPITQIAEVYTGPRTRRRRPVILEAGRMKRLLSLFLFLGMCGSRISSQEVPPAKRESGVLPDFSYTQGWLGADDAYSVPLTPRNSLWLFGDTFVGSSETKLRSQAKTMVRNSIGISDCDPGGSCSMQYSWQKATGPKPRSFFDSGTDAQWYWPLDGFRHGSAVYISLLAVRNKPGSSPKDAFGFEITGTKLATVKNVHQPPEKWGITIQDLTDGHLWAGVSLVPTGSYVIWYTQVSRGEGRGYMTVMRVPEGRMAKPSGHWEYLRKDGQWRKGLAGEDSMHVIEQPISEMSVRYHASIGKWLALSQAPEFPPGGAVARSAESPIGPWSDPHIVYEFPEMQRGTPGYDKDTFCYAVKEHIEFTDVKIALTYACNSMVFAKVVADMNIYRPRGVILDLPK